MWGIDSTVVIAGASVVNVIVLIGYAISTYGIQRATQQQVTLTADLAKQSKDANRLQILVAYQEEIRAGRATSRSMAGVALMERALKLAFPEDWQELRKIIDEAADAFVRDQAQGKHL